MLASKGCGVTGTLMPHWWEGKSSRTTSENTLAASHKVKRHLPYDPVIRFLGIYPRKMKTNIHKRL